MLLLGASMWGTLWYPMRLLEAHGFYGLWLTLVVYAAALSASLPTTASHLHELVAHRRVLLPLAIAAGCTNVAFLLAVLDGNVMRVLLLFYLSPLWAIALGWLVLSERPSARALTTLALALAGALIILWDPLLGIPWPRSQPDWLALVAGIAFAVSNVLVRKAQEVSVVAKAASTWVGVILLSALLAVLFGVPMPVVMPHVWLGAVTLGIFGILIMTVLVLAGVTRLPVQRSAVILLFELVAGAVSQRLLSHERMTLVEWAGGILIVLAALLSARGGRGEE
jgi:drug/metabolite transporter (DMT)-like permease